MKFLCEKCHTRYTIADDRVRGRVLKIRCKSCSHVITVREDLPSTTTVSPPAGASTDARIEEEFQRTRSAILQITRQPELLESARVVRATVGYRNPALFPLNVMQVALMDRWESLSEEERSGPWREAMLQTIAGIAAAMQSTG